MARERLRTEPEGTEYEPGPVEPDEAPESVPDQSLLGDLALLTGAEFQDVDWYIYRLRTKAERDANPGCKTRELVLKRSGAIDLAELARDLGGGDFDFYPVYDSGDGLGKRIRSRQRHAFAGPRRDFNAAPAAALAPAPIAVGTSDPALVRLLERIGERLERLEAPKNGGITELISSLAALDALRARNTPPPAAAPAEGAKPVGLPDLVGALAQLDQLRGGTGPREQSPLEVAKMVLDGFHQGVVIGQEREPIPSPNPDGPNYGPMIEKGLEILQTILARQRRPGPPGGPPRPPSSATVVEEPPAAAPTAPSTPEHRWKTAVESLYRAMIHGRDPGDFASSLEDILDEEELANLRGDVTADQVLEYLKPLLAQYPVLSQQQGRVYLGAVLAALREDEPEAAGAAN